MSLAAAPAAAPPTAAAPAAPAASPAGAAAAGRSADAAANTPPRATETAARDHGTPPSIAAVGAGGPPAAEGDPLSAFKDLDEEKSVHALMRPHVGSRVRVVGGDGSGCLKPGQVGRIVEDDRSPIPFKVDAGNGDTSWYREDQLEHLAEYTVEDVLDQQRLVSLFGSEGTTAFNVSNTRFSFQASRARERTTEVLHPRTIGRNGRRAATATTQACCPWCTDPRHRPLLVCILYLCVLVPFVVIFTASHALGYRVRFYQPQPQPQPQPAGDTPPRAPTIDIAL